MLVFGLSACSSINNISTDSANQNTDKEKISSDIEEGKKVEKSEGELDDQEAEKPIDDWQNNIINKPCNSVSEEKKIGYQVWDDCLYKDNKLVFEHNLMYEIAQNGGEEYKNFFYDRKWGEGAGEWARFELNNNLRIFLASAGPCGGCYFTGSYLEINKSNENIQIKFADLPPIDKSIISPNSRYVVYVDVPNYDNGPTEVKLYDFYELKDKGVIYTIPRELTIQRCYDGCYIIEEDRYWLDDNRLALKIMKRQDQDMTDIDKIEYVGDPVIIDIRNFL